MGGNMVRRLTMRGFVMSGLLMSSLGMMLWSSDALTQAVAVETRPTASRLAPVTVSVTNAPLVDVLEILARQAKLRPYWSDKMFDSRMRVALHVRGMPVDEAFATVLAGTGLVAVIEEGRVSIARAAAALVASVQGGIAGKIVDAKTKQALKGATVTLDDNLKGVVSGDDGGFRLVNVAPGQHTIRAKMLGYVRAAKTVTVLDGQTLAVEIVLEPSVNALDQVVVTGTIVATAQREIPNAMTVITAKDLEERGITRIDELFRGDVPGLYAQDRGSANLLDTTVMISRGATYLGRTEYPAMKTYVDGIEMANSAYLSQIDPRSIERIEILTGPQASTIYGSNAINGVMQIFTKRGHSARPQVTANLLSGFVQNDFRSALTPQHDYSAQVSGVEARLSYSTGGSWIYLGPWTPAKQTTRINGFGGLKSDWETGVGTVSTDASIRLSTTVNQQRGGTQQGYISLFETGFWRPSGFASSGLASPGRAQLASRMLGLTMGYAPTPWWSHQLVFGSDVAESESRYTASGYSSSSDSLLSYSTSATRRTSWRYMTTGRAPVTSHAQMTVTAGLDQWYVLTNSMSGAPTALTGTLSASRWTIRRQPTRNAGGFLQGQLSIRDVLFLTSGLRAEWNPNYGDDAQPNLAPRYGAAMTRDFNTPWGGFTMKLRASYGRSTRPPAVNQKIGQTVSEYYAAINPTTGASLVEQFGNFDIKLANPELGPETQRGGEGGLELYLGNRASLVITRYNQTVDQLIIGALAVDSVRSLKPVSPDESCLRRGTDGYCYQTQQQNLNLGSIRNQGWETQGTLTLGPLTTKGTYSWTKSRVIGIQDRYRSLFPPTSYPQYQPGAMMFFVPEHTWGVDLTYASARSVVRMNVNGIAQRFRNFSDELYYTGIYSYIRLDANRLRITETRDGLYGSPGAGYVLANLNASHRFSSSVEGVLQVENLADRYPEDYWFIYASMGRQTKAGIRVRW